MSTTLRHSRSEYAGRETPLTFCPNVSQELGCRIYLKREDLVHGGSHKLNNTLGQALLAKHMGKKRLIAETGAGQHGVATALIGAALGIPVEIFMGEVDTKRQALNVFRMELMGAKVIPVKSGTRTLKDAMNEALRDWVANVRDTYYLIGIGSRPAPVSPDGPRLPVRYRERGAPPGDEKGGTAPGHDRCLCWRRIECHGDLLPVCKR